jgi:hypothetical protein
MSIKFRCIGTHSWISIIAATLLFSAAATVHAQPATEIQGELRPIHIEAIPASSPADAHWRAVVTVENTGKTNFQPTGQFEILDVRGNVVQAVDFPTPSVVGEREQRFVFPVKMELAAGSYTLRARIDIGTGEIRQTALDIVIDRPSRRIQADYPIPIFPQR